VVPFRKRPDRHEASELLNTSEIEAAGAAQRGRPAPDEPTRFVTRTPQKSEHTVLMPHATKAAAPTQAPEVPNESMRSSGKRPSMRGAMKRPADDEHTMLRPGSYTLPSSSSPTPAAGTPSRTPSVTKLLVSPVVSPRVSGSSDAVPAAPVNAVAAQPVAPAAPPVAGNPRLVDSGASSVLVRDYGRPLQRLPGSATLKREQWVVRLAAAGIAASLLVVVLIAVLILRPSSRPSESSASAALEPSPTASPAPPQVDPLAETPTAAVATDVTTTPTVVVKTTKYGTGWAAKSKSLPPPAATVTSITPGAVAAATSPATAPKPGKASATPPTALTPDTDATSLTNEADQELETLIKALGKDPPPKQ
jgi:hypothetical protein